MLIRSYYSKLDRNNIDDYYEVHCPDEKNLKKQIKEVYEELLNNDNPPSSLAEVLEILKDRKIISDWSFSFVENFDCDYGRFTS